MGGGGEANTNSNSSSRGGGGLARYRSAPATWLEALLESDIDEQNSNNFLLLKQPPHQLSSPDNNMFDEHDTVSLFRQNSSPAEFLGSDTYFSTYQMIGAAATTTSSNYDFTLSPSSSSIKRQRDDGFDTHLKEEDQSEHLERGLSGLLDPEMEKLLEDSVPCRVRAKRGCATHPRSIAERVRRTRISDRIRKLQDLVPNMEKQTNTADMLEEAVEYVKLLQKQIQELTEQQKNCKCVHKE